jgi:hypothetical protein
MNSLLPLVGMIAEATPSFSTELAPALPMFPLAVLFPTALAALDINNLSNIVIPVLFNLIGAVLILAIGWIVAKWIAGFTRQLLKKTTLDEQIARTVSGRGRKPVNVENILVLVAEWIVKLLAIVAALNVLNLNQVSAPLTGLIGQILQFLPRLAGALALLGLAWIAAVLIKGIVVNAAESFDIDARLNSASAEGANISLGETIGNAAYWFVFLFAFPFILSAVGLDGGPLAPVQELLQTIVQAIPRILSAGAVIAIAYFIGKILADIITNLLAGSGFDGFVNKLGITAGQPAMSPSKLIGTIVMVATVLVALVPAVDLLQLPTLQGLVKDLLQIAGQVIVGVLFFGAGLFVANWVADLIRSSGMKESNLLATAAKVAIMFFSGAMALRQIGVATDIVNLTFGLLLGALAVAVAIAFGLGGRDVAAEQLRDWTKPFKR